MRELLGTPAEVPGIVFRTLVVYVFILLAFRLSGKREVGQLSLFDFALVLLIANAVQNAMVGASSSLVGGLAAAGVLITTNHALGRLAVRSRGAERLLRGRARILVSRGHPYPESMRAEGISHEELLQALRENGCPTILDCRLAVLEVDGTISVIPART